MKLQHKNRILEVSITSDSLFRLDNYTDAKHESQSHSLIFHNIHNPEWAARSLRNIRHVKHVINVGESAITENFSLYVVKVLYDSNAIADHEIEKLDTFRRIVKNVIDNSVAHHPHL